MLSLKTKKYGVGSDNMAMIGCVDFSVNPTMFSTFRDSLHEDQIELCIFDDTSKKVWVIWNAQ